MYSKPPVLVGYKAVRDEQFERLAAVVRAAKAFNDGYAYTRLNPLTRALAALTPDDIEAVQIDNT